MLCTGHSPTKLCTLFCPCSAKWLASVKASQRFPLKRERKWVIFFEAIVFLGESPTKCPFPEQGNKEGFLYYNPNSLSAITWPKSFLFQCFFISLKDILPLVIQQHPLPPQCVPFQVFLLLFVTDTWSHVFSANALLFPLLDAINLEAPSSCMCVPGPACFAMCPCSRGCYLLFLLPDLGKASLHEVPTERWLLYFQASVKPNQVLAILVLF